MAFFPRYAVTLSGRSCVSLSAMRFLARQCNGRFLGNPSRWNKSTHYKVGFDDGELVESFYRLLGKLEHAYEHSPYGPT